ncbi:MAG: hypothetical protein CMF74_18815 [Maricaulis sp.]|nr:hypothetical protein [Maricaulis sp.]
MCLLLLIQQIKWRILLMTRKHKPGITTLDTNPSFLRRLPSLILILVFLELVVLYSLAMFIKDTVEHNNGIYTKQKTLQHQSMNCTLLTDQENKVLKSTVILKEPEHQKAVLIHHMNHSDNIALLLMDWTSH